MPLASSGSSADPFDGFDGLAFTAEGRTYPLFRIGSGPGVVVMTEMPGISRKVAAFGRRLADEGFTGDKFVPKERFETLRRELGDRFIDVEIDSSEGNPYGIPKNAHSVLTEHLVDEPGHPTHDALNQVITFFKDRLAA